MMVADGSGLLCDGKQQVENALTGVRGEAGPGSPEGRLPKLPVTQLSQACSGYREIHDSTCEVLGTLKSFT